MVQKVEQKSVRPKATAWLGFLVAVLALLPLVATTGPAAGEARTAAAAGAASAGSVLYRINAGGPGLSGTPSWAPDTATNPSPYVNAIDTGNKTDGTSAAIDLSHSSLPAGTPEKLFQKARWDPEASPELEWNFPVTPGQYEVRLYFAETWTGAQLVGGRVFDVTIEGALVLDNYDTFADVGGNRGVMKSFVVASDANLDLDFGHVVQNPSIKGIEILTAESSGNVLTASPSSLSFGSVLMGSSKTLAVTLSNLGGEGDPSIVVDSTTISGTHAALFSDSFNDAGDVTLPPGGSTTLNVTFTPTSSGSKTATLAIAHTGNGSPTTVPLSGSGAGDGAWTTRAPAPTTRQEVGSVWAGGKLYVAGGSTAHEAYDPAPNTWTTRAPLPIDIHHVQAVELAGKIYYIGGLTSWPGPHVSTVYIYNPATNTFTQGAPMPRGRGAGGVAAHNGKIYYAGGLHNGVAVAWFDVYDPAANTWTQLPDMPRVRDHFHAAVVNGKLYAIGGRDRDINATTPANDAFTFSTNSWSTGLAPLPTPRGGYAAAVLGNEILVIGGEGGGNAYSAVEAYDTVANTWRTLAPMPTARHGIQAAVCNGAVHIVAGGTKQGGSAPTNVHEVFSLNGSTCVGGGDASPPVVTTVVPQGGAVSVSPATTVRATFSEALDPATVTASTFRLARTADGAAVSATVSYDDASRTATLDPVATLANGVGYTATLVGGASGVKDASGNPLAANYTWSFTTAQANTLAATPASLSFPATTVGSSTTASVQVTNAGGAGDPSVVLDATAISGTGSASFSDGFDDAGSVTLAPGASTTITVTFAPTASGTASATLSITHSGANTPLTVPLTGTATAPSGGQVLYRVNAGGPALGGTPGWTADTQASPSPYVNAAETGNKTHSTKSVIDMTHPSVPAGTPEKMFKKGRWDPEAAPAMRWAFPVAPGRYEVRLYFAETWSGAFVTGGRVFDVRVEGALLLDNYDAYADVGANRGVVKTFRVTSDSSLDIDFGHVVQNPSIKGIEVVAAPSLPNQLGAAPAAADFGSVTLGSQKSLSLQLTNLGESGDPSIVVDATTITGSGATRFSDSFNDAGNVTLAPGASTNVNVTFTPAATGTVSASLEVAHSGTNTPLVVPLAGTGTSTAVVGFGKSSLGGASSSRPTSLEFGPDGRLYVAQQDGLIKAYTVGRTGPNTYAATATETITLVKQIPNHNDNGALAPTVTERIITGLHVTGAAASPVIYVTSSDPRIGGGNSGEDLGLDTNSSMVSRLTKSGGSWTKVDLVRGLPRSEENHSANGVALDPLTNTLYVTMGGNTNKGGPSNNFALLPEFALSAAILSVDLDAIGNTTYDLPTLDDEDRAGSPDAGDPFGGNNGKNQARLVPGGPVQVYAPGFRNPYDVVITTSARMYTIDNGSNGGWGDIPIGEGPGGTCTNAVSEPGSTDPDTLHLVSGPGYYGGHPNPTRGNMANSFNANGQSPVSSANAVECDYRSTNERGAITTFKSSTNGIVEYTASNFDDAMKGDILTASFDNAVYRMKLNATDGKTLEKKEALFSSVGSHPLDVTAQGDADVFPGTVWVADIATGAIVVFEPNDYGGSTPTCTGADDPSLDEDSDGFDNADEIDNGTNPCSSADVPPDWDGDDTSNLNDPDDDNDGRPDTSDPFAVDAANGANTPLPVSYTWDNDAPDAGGLLGLGFTGLMTNGSANYESLFDAGEMTAGGAAGVTTVDAVPDGDALGAANTQQYGFQFGVAATTATFTAHTRILSPFAGLTPQDAQSMGLFVGTGDQDNYVKIVVDANGGAGGVKRVSEIAGAVSQGPTAAVALPGPSAIDLYLEVSPSAGTVQASYTVTADGTTSARTNLGTAVSIPSSWLSSPTKLAVGIISTSAGPAPPFAATWDFVDVR